MGIMISNRFADFRSTMPSYLATILDLEGINTFLSLFEYIHNQEGTFTQGFSKLNLDDAILLVQKTRKYLEPPRTNNGSFFQSYEIVMQQTIEKELQKISRKLQKKAIEAEKARFKMDQLQQIKEIMSPFVDSSSQQIKVVPKHNAHFGEIAQ